MQCSPFTCVKQKQASSSGGALALISWVAYSTVHEPFLPLSPAPTNLALLHLFNSDSQHELPGIEHTPASTRPINCPLYALLSSLPMQPSKLHDVTFQASAEFSSSRSLDIKTMVYIVTSDIPGIGRPPASPRPISFTLFASLSSLPTQSSSPHNMTFQAWGTHLRVPDPSVLLCLPRLTLPMLLDTLQRGAVFAARAPGIDRGSGIFSIHPKTISFALFYA